MLKTKDGINLFTQSWKATDPKAIVVLTHGFGEHSSRYPHVGKALSQAGYSLYTYDLRGHGQSGGPRGHTPAYESLLDDLEAVIADAKSDQPGKKVFVYGHSMGGNITLNYALRRPSGLSGVITTGAWLKLAFDPPALQLALGRLMANLIPTFAQQSNLDVNALSHDPAISKAYAEDKLVHSTITARLFVEIVGAGEYALAHAAELTLPVLLMHGGGDLIISPGGTRQFHERATVADKTIRMYDGLFHEIHNELEQATVFKDMIEWLNRHC
ncbi:MAG: lysophospholipase [Chloroflexi bacterium]|nr:lysophospholipase [Chloroflexota bacterium]